MSVRARLRRAECAVCDRYTACEGDAPRIGCLLLKQPCQFHVEGGLVRTERLLRIPSTVNDTRLIAHLSAVKADFRCPESRVVPAAPFRVFNDGNQRPVQEERARRRRWGLRWH